MAIYMDLNCIEQVDTDTEHVFLYLSYCMVLLAQTDLVLMEVLAESFYIICLSAYECLIHSGSFGF